MQNHQSPRKLYYLIVIVLLSAFIASCRPGPCNGKLLEKVQDTKPTKEREDTIKEWSEAFFVLFANAKEGTFSWDIRPRSDYGCIVALSGDVNGVKTEGYVWFVDLEENKIYPDDVNAKALVKGWIQGSGNTSLLSGIPLP
jgi:hypothetical protein